MSKKILLTVIAILIVGFVTATALFLYPYEPKKPPKANETGWTEQGVQEVVNANNKFALELYSELSESEEGNIFYSPYSIFSALAMTYEGARGNTAKEMEQTLHFPGKDILRPNFARIYNEINKPNDAYELRTGNALWVQKNYPIHQSYMDVVEKYYGGKATNLDFAHETEKSRETINSFIEEQTNGKIKELIPRGVLTPATVLVITNAIYFKGTWQFEFDPKNTREMDFKTPNGNVKVDMMYMNPEKAKFNYTDLEDLQILELPYKGGKVSMLILLPKENLSSIEPLTVEKLEEWKKEMKETKLDAIYIPKFEFTKKYSLNKALKALGMPTAFTSNADFSGITSDKIWIDSVIHQAYIKVDEKGTEAAAATAVTMVRSAMPKNVFKADHPFIFIIQERETGNILFMGRIMNPRG